MQLQTEYCFIDAVLNEYPLLPLDGCAVLHPRCCQQNQPQVRVEGPSSSSARDAAGIQRLEMQLAHALDTKSEMEGWQSVHSRFLDSAAPIALSDPPQLAAMLRHVRSETHPSAAHEPYGVYVPQQQGSFPLSRAGVEPADRSFDSIDRNMDGVIDRREFSEYVSGIRTQASVLDNTSRVMESSVFSKQPAVVPSWLEFQNQSLYGRPK